MLIFFRENSTGANAPLNESSHVGDSFLRGLIYHMV